MTSIFLIIYFHNALSIFVRFGQNLSSFTARQNARLTVSMQHHCSVEGNERIHIFASAKEASHIQRNHTNQVKMASSSNSGQVIELLSDKEEERSSSVTNALSRKQQQQHFAAYRSAVGLRSLYLEECTSRIRLCRLSNEASDACRALLDVCRLHPAQCVT